MSVTKLPVTKESNERKLRAIVRGMYDFQKLRIMIGNRIVSIFKHKLGQTPGKKEEDIEKEELKLIKSLRNEFKKITDGIIEKGLKRVTDKNLAGYELITDTAEFAMVQNYVELESMEANLLKQIEPVLCKFPIYTEYLINIKGIGPSMAGILLSELDPHKALYPSSFWKYAGLDVAEDGRGRGRYKEHLVDKEFINKDGEPDTKKGITFNPLLKDKLIGVLGPCFIKVNNPDYRKIYDDYKNRLKCHPDHKDKTPLHIHNMSIRYMIKRFLVDLHTKWREIEGLPVNEEYAVAKLGIVHSR